jgi:hypothetical protein
VDFSPVHAFFECRIILGHDAKHIHPASCAQDLAKIARKSPSRRRPATPRERGEADIALPGRRPFTLRELDSLDDALITVSDFHVALASIRREVVERVIYQRLSRVGAIKYQWNRIHQFVLIERHRRGS